MNKILLACDGKHFSEGAFEFIRQINTSSPVLVTGVFLAEASYGSLWSYASGLSGPLFVPVVEQEYAQGISSSISRFEQLCIANGMDFRTHKDDYDFALSELKTETRFADLLVIGGQCFYKDLKGAPNDYLLDMMHHTECPVLIVPEQFQSPQSIILSYDGSRDSVYSIKQFAYLFPEWKDKPTTLLYANEQFLEEDIPAQTQMEEWASRHFNDLTIEHLGIDPEKFFTVWVENEPGALLVTGSYGRSGLSQLFHKSYVREIIQDHWVPVFIAHK
jgi:nucleotide-binding universal stress UspA family protein